MVRVVLRKLRAVFGVARAEAQLDAEIRDHLESLTEDYRRRGVDDATARAAARRDFGGVDQMKECYRDQRGFPMIEAFAQDLRYATRGFRRNPVFAFTAITCLVLGIVPNIVLFHIATNTLLNSPSVRDPKTLFGVMAGGNTSIPVREYRFLRGASRDDGLVGSAMGTVNWRHDERVEALDVARVTDHFFDVTGIPLASGRPIQSGETNVVVVSDRFWKKRVGGDPNVLGRHLELDNRFYTIVGVLPSNHRTVFPLGMAVDLYVPLPSDDWTVWLYSRASPGMTADGVAARLESALRELDRVYPDPDYKWSENTLVYQPDGPGFTKLGEQIGFPVRAFLAMLAIVVALVLLTACANVSGLLLARGSARTAEFAIRVSLGATRGRMVRQLLAESFLLVLAATVAGALVTLLLAPLFAIASDARLALQADWRLFGYSTFVATVATFVCGVLPAVRHSHASIGTASRVDVRSGGWTVRGALVIGQLAVSVVLLCAALLFVRNLQRASTVDPGFDIDHTLRANMHVPGAYRLSHRSLLVDTALQRLRAEAGIRSAAVASLVPLAGNLISQADWITDTSADVVHIDARFNEVGANYFSTLDIPVLLGREFAAEDRAGTARVVILNQTMARRLFGAVNPIGHLIRRKAGQPFLVVGVARDSKYSSLGEKDVSAYFQAYSQTAASSTDRSDLHFVIRASGSATTALVASRRVLTQIDSAATLDIKPLRENVQDAKTPSRISAAVLSAIGLLALFLSSAGLYGVLQYSVSRRTREIGVRMALGATRAGIVRLFMGQSALLVAGGLAIGLGISVFAVRPLAMFLIADVRPVEAANFVIVSAVLCLVALGAALSPMVRALRADPMTALRHE
jgi:predicted permease